MSTQIEILNSFNKQIAPINNALMRGDNNTAVMLTEKLVTYLKVKTKEIGESDEKEDGK